MRALLAVASLALVAGCSQPPTPSTALLDLEVPDDWAMSPGFLDVARSEAPDENWWTSFDDATLDSLVTEALRANRDLDAALANVEAARATARIQGADRWPQINGNARGSRSKQIFVGLPIPGEGVAQSLSNNFGLSAEASWEIDLWNRLGLRARAARAEFEASEAELAGARLSVAGLTARTWIGLTEIELQRELAERSLTAYRSTAQIADDRYTRGLLNSVDVYLTRTSSENAAALVALRENQLQQTSRRLEVLLGRYPSGALRGADTLAPPPPAVPAGLPVDLVLRRPDLLAAERRMVAASARTGEARRNLLPRISLTGSAGTTSNEVGDLLDGDFSVWSIAGSLLQPIFQGGRLRAQVAANVAGEDAALARFAQSALDAFSEVETALAAESLLATRESHLAAALENASGAWRIAEDRYRQGVGDLLSVLESQRRALNAESELIAVRAARLQARVDLHLALGGGFDARRPPSDSDEIANAAHPTSSPAQQ